MRWTKVVALAAAGSLSLAACGGSPASKSSDKSGGAGGAGGTSATAEKASAGFDPSAKGPVAMPEGAKKGGTLTVAYASVPETFDPTRSYYQDTNAILSQLVLRSLTNYKVMDGKSVLVPDLATDLGKESADGLTWTFTLKDGIKYSDGTPIKAADIVYATKRTFATKELPDGPTYAQEYMKGGDKYKGPFSDKSAFPGVEAPDDKTVVFHMAKKWPTFPYYAAFTQTAPIPQAKDTKDKYGDMPLGTGPYMFASYSKGQELKLKKNPNWDPKTDPSRQQLVDGFDFKFGVETVPTQQAILASNGTDATTLNWDSIDSSLTNKVQAQSKQLVTGPDPCVSYMNLDTRKIPLEVRKAVALAYPYDDIRKAAGETTLSFNAATSYMAPQVPGFTKYAPVNSLTGQGAGDPAAAKAALQKAGKMGFELSWYYANDNRLATQSNAVKKAKFIAAGFKVHDIGVSKTDLRKKRTDTSGTTVNTGTGPGGWCYDWPSGDSVYPPLFASANLTSGLSVGYLSDKGLDADMQRISALPAEQQGTEWSKFDEKLAKDYVPAIPTDAGKANFLFGTKVHNVQNDPNRGMPDLSQIWLG